MKKLSFALACAASAVLFGATVDSIGFESYAENFTGLSGKMDDGAAGQGPTDSHWLYEGTSDGSTVKAYGNDNLPVPAGSLSGEVGQKYLELSTEGGTLWRSFAGLASATNMGAAQTVGTAGVYIDTMVQFTPTEDGGTPEVGTDDKIAIWLNVDTQQNTTNLCVRASTVDDNGTATSCSPATFVLNPTDPTNPVKAGTWYRLTIKAIADVDQRMAKNPEAYPDGVTGFQIFLDGQLLSSSTPSFANGYIGLATDAGEYGWLDQNNDAALISFLQSGSVFASLKGFETTSTVQGIGFKGSGAIDDLIFKDENPFPAPVDVDFTVTIPTGATATYAIGDAAATALPAGGVISGPAGAAYTVTITLADGTVAVKTGTLSEDGSADYSAVDWSFYLAGAGTQAEPYVVDSLTELQDFKKGVDGGLATTGLYFAQTNDIDMASAGAWDGIGGNGKGTAPFFQGTYDGCGKTISNLTLARAKYRGFFDSCRSATIKDLTISVAGIAAGDSEAGFAAFVGSGDGTMFLQRLTANGTIGTSSAYSKHTTAGIAVSFCGTVDCCTNNATIFAAIDNTKVGGMVGIAQGGASVYSNCLNTAAITANKTSGANDYVEGVGGIVGYNSSSVTFVNCVNTGVITDETNNGRAGQIIGHAQASTVLGEGCKGLATAGDPIGLIKSGVAVSGFELEKTVDTMVEYYAGLAGSGTVEAPFLVAKAADLETLRFGVELGAYGLADQVFQQTADIDMSGTAAFGGIGQAGVENDALLTATAFAATYDGNNKTISNLKMAIKKGSGLFNCVRGGTVKDLTIDTVTYDGTFGKKQGGAMFVGICCNATLKHLVANGSNGTAANPISYNAAGIVDRIELSQGDTLLDGCTNNAAQYCCYTKIAGMCPIVQGKNGSYKVTFKDCANFGALNGIEKAGTTFADSDKHAGADGIVGILGYAQGVKGSESVEMINCVNFGTITCDYASAKKANLHGGGTELIVSASGCMGLAAYPPYKDKPGTLTGIDIAVSYPEVHLDYTMISAYVADNQLPLYFGMLDNGDYPQVTATSYNLKIDVTHPVVTNHTFYAATITKQDGSAATTSDVSTLLTGLIATGYELKETMDGETLTGWTIGAAPVAAYPTYIAADDAAKKAKYDTWKGLYGADTASAFEEAFLLNVDPTSAQALADAKAAFAISSIEYANGVWVVKVAGDKGDGDAYANGTIDIKGCATLDGEYNLEPSNSNAKFFKAFLK